MCVRLCVLTDSQTADEGLKTVFRRQLTVRMTGLSKSNWMGMAGKIHVCVCVYLSVSMSVSRLF